VLCNGQQESQVVSKHFADEFNKTPAPKKVDFIMPYCIEMCRREGQPWYNVEVMMTPGKHGVISQTIRRCICVYGSISDRSLVMAEH